MPILRDIAVCLTAEELLSAQRSQSNQPGLVAAAEQAIRLGDSLVSPAVVYDEFEVGSSEGERVSVAPLYPSSLDPLHLTLGPKANLLAPARRLLVAVYTIGPALEARVGELARDRESLQSYLLDCVGVMALGAIGERVRGLAGDVATARAWGVSPALSPGSLVGWSLQGQRELCSLLPIADIGVRLNDYCVLEPHKSVSLVIGVGPGYESHEVGSVCLYCALKDSCWRRHRNEA